MMFWMRRGFGSFSVEGMGWEGKGREGKGRRKGGG